MSHADIEALFTHQEEQRRSMQGLVVALMTSAGTLAAGLLCLILN